MKRMATQQIQQQQKRSPLRNHKLRRNIIIAVAVIAVGGIAWAKLSGGGTPEETEALFTVKPGDLLISVLESGKIQANKSVNLTCELEGQSTIISIVPEGSYVKEGDVLVELDSASLRDEIEQQQITAKSAESARLQASEALAIQENQNDSDIKAAELARDFALIDLKKYTGEVAYKKALEAYQQDKKQETAETKVTELAPYFAALDPEKDYVDGDWHQQLLTAENTITTAGTKLKLAEKKLEGTTKLLERGYVTKTDWEGDKASWEGTKIDLDQANEKKKLIVNYDHPKQLAKFIADYEEAEKGLGRAKRKADSQLAQKQADLDAKEATSTTQKLRLDKFTDQLGKAVIKAPQPGLVIYGSSSGEPFHRERGLVAEGESVYERQKLIELPDLSTLKVQVSVHESARDMIKPGQEAVVTVEALSGLTLRGHVDKVAILPDAQQNWMNPDLTVYSTLVLLDEQAETLKPGMTANVEIVVAELKDVLYVPVQSVSVRNEREVCFVMKESGTVTIPVESGLANNNYIEIKSGLKKGDKVLTYAPVTASEETVSRKAKLPGDEKTTQPSGGPALGTKGTEAAPEGEAAPDREQRTREFMKNMTPEQRKQMEERLKSLGIEGDLSPESMTPERMKEIRQKMMEQRGGGAPGGEGFRRVRPGQGDTPGGGGPGGEGPRPTRPGQTDTPGGRGPGGEGSPRMRGGQSDATGGGPTGGPGGRSGSRRNETSQTP
jgi:HlyD family secretion protein